MQRSISAGEENSELTDEAALQRDFESFKDAFADLVDWEHARYVTTRALIHT